MVKDYETWIKEKRAKLDLDYTSDETYTPKEVYSEVLEIVHTLFPDFDDSKIIRPFYPGGDYTKEDYTDRVVVDNPPFSKTAEILRFYKEHNIKFFLFSDARYLFDHGLEYGYVIAGRNFTYENKVAVPTDFITNMISGVIIYPKPKPKPKPKLNVVKNPENTRNAASLRKYCKQTSVPVHLTPVELVKKDLNGRLIFGGGFKFKEDIESWKV